MTPNAPTTPPAATRRLSILTILGTRPELVKLAPFIPLADADPQLQQRVLHTGQHYSVDMDAVFFEELALRPPDVTLQVGSQSHAAQTAAILVGVEAALLSHPPDVVVVLGDTNSTLGGALAAAKLGIPIVHIEAGCRSFLRAMPEEINRVVTDHCASLLLCPNAQAQAQLQAEGIASDSIVVVGSTSIDAARSMQARAQGRPIIEQVCSALGLGPTAASNLLTCTVHRAENTTPEVLPGLIAGLEALAVHYPIAWPVHPRTRKVMQQLGLVPSSRIHLLPPVGYLDMLALLQASRALCTDSGGLQEEAYALGTPVLVLRNETEWSYLVDAGCAALCGNTAHDIPSRALPLLTAPENARMRAAAKTLTTQLADGGAAARILAAIKRRFLP